jgi:hypothetical protein
MAIPPITRLGARKLTDYLDQIKDRDYSQPDADTLKAISTLVNQATVDSFHETDTFLQSCPQIKRGIKALSEAPCLRGPAKQAKHHLQDFTPYEQICTLSNWIGTYDFPQGKRTLAFHHEDGSIPITITPPRKSQLDLYPVFIGNSSGNLKGPAYREWQEKDPEGTSREIFIDALDALEIHRTGMGDGALLLKKGAYESGAIDHTWRYAVFKADGSDAPEASVELPRQKQAKARRARAYAPGFNLAEMIANRPLRNRNIMPERLYEDFCDDGYNDEATSTVTPMKIVKSFESAIRGDTEELDLLVRQLSASHLGVSQLPVVKDFTARRLFF